MRSVTNLLEENLFMKKNVELYKLSWNIEINYYFMKYSLEIEVVY